MLKLLQYQASSELISVVSIYDPNLTIIIAGYASAYGIGSVISHILSYGSEKPIAFSSWTISAGKNIYGQLEKEVLSLMFGVKKYHQYGRTFIVITDYK